MGFLQLYILLYYIYYRLIEVGKITEKKVCVNPDLFIQL